MIRKVYALALAIGVSAGTLMAQPKTKDDAILMTVGGEPVYLSEFEAIFRKNNQKSAVTREALDEYMELFTIFKLKVKEARDLGLDTSRAFQQELNAYVRQLSAPYLRDTAAENELLRSTYNRMLTDREIGQLLIRVDRCATPQDTLKAYQTIRKIRDDIRRGRISFVDAVKKYSEDSLTRNSGGYIGWVTAPGMGLSYELGVYNTPVGEVSDIVRTSQGYHLIHVKSERPARGRIRLAHIFIAGEMQDKDKREAAYNRAMEARNEVLSGKPWNEVVRAYSDNQNTAIRGGELPPFGINTYATEFENEAFALSGPDEISMPIASPEGFHILRLIEKQGIPSFAQMRPELYKSLSKTSRWQVPLKVFVSRLKSQYGYEENLPAINAMLNAMKDQLYNESMLNAKAKEWVFRFAGNSYTWGDVAAFLSSQSSDKPVTGCTFRERAVDAFAEKMLLEHKESMLPEENVSFFYLVREYREGILLFTLMDQKVWKRSVRDTAGLEAYHAENREKYMWGPRTRAYIVDCKNDQVETEARKLAPKLMNGKMSREQFVEKLNKRVADNVIVMEGLYQEGENPMVNAVSGPQGISQTFRTDGKIRFAVVAERIPPTPKSLKECRGVVTSDYSNYLEQDWIKSLREKYPVKVNRDVLYRLISQ